MITEAIKAIQTAGFSVYQREPGDTYAYFTDGKNIGYIQADRFRGFSLSTVHIPSHTTGTGFSIDQGLDLADLTQKRLSLAFIFAPGWATTQDAESVKKWRDMQHFLSHDSWQAGFKLVVAQ